jgi:hypothetical protein
VINRKFIDVRKRAKDNIRSGIVNHFVPGISAVCSLYVNGIIDSIRGSFNRFGIVIRRLSAIKFIIAGLLNRKLIRLVIIGLTGRIAMPIE